MWVISGPFDAPEKNEIGFKKSKLLKTGTRYSLGRKERQLNVNHAKVSHDHGAFAVASASPDDVANPTVQPSLSIHNSGKKTITVTREGELIAVTPSGSEDLQDGDIIDIVVGVALNIKWLPVCCLAPIGRGSSLISLDACASLGVKVVHASHPSVTHHLIPQFAANPSVAASLVSAAQFVKHEWLTELIRLCDIPLNDDPSIGCSLEQNFALPHETKYRPSFGAALPVSLKAFRVWEPNEERINMFLGYRFLFVGEKGREVEGAMTELVRRGGGEYEAFDVGKGHKNWHRTLVKGKAKQEEAERGKGLVIVADERAMEIATGSASWQNFIAVAKEFQLRFIDVDHILQAVLHVDLSLISCSTGVTLRKSDQHFSSSPPDFVPNTHPEELTDPPHNESEASSKPVKILKRRATPSAVTRSPSPAAVGNIQEDEARPRKVLKRRANAPPTSIIGIDDPSIIAASDIAAMTSPHAVKPSLAIQMNAPIPSRSSRLKRRAGTITSSFANTLTAESQDFAEAGYEPPLKKFKALFDASHPDNSALGNTIESGPSYGGTTPEYKGYSLSGTQTQSGATSTGRDGVKGAELAIVAEEEEESGLTWTQDRGTKRKAGENDTENTVEILSVEHQLEPGNAPKAKRRAVENLNAIQPISDGQAKPTSKSPSKAPSKPGAATGKPDTDVAFLTAVASTKRGKKAEDSFDREFNKLKISKPDVLRDEQEKEWGILGDFETERDIRGNFMVVMEMDVYSSSMERNLVKDKAARLEWQAQPNFKKFKKKPTSSSKPRVDLTANEDNDYGMGTGYWKGSSQPQSQGELRKSQLGTQKKSAVDIQASQDKSASDIDGRADSKPPPPKPKHPTQPVEVMQSRPQSNRGAYREKSRPLFAESDEDEKKEFHPPSDMDDDGNEIFDLERTQSDYGTTLRSSEQELCARPARSSKPTSKRGTKMTPAIVDDDSDDGATFKGFKGKSRVMR